ncbi:MAG: SIR2 family protein [Halobacteriovoraceae bacterium]|nr:SIR2 family protein [Halobacteriovoraceae bacterium]
MIKNEIGHEVRGKVLGFKMDANTTFIIGAGGHAPYGFPISTRLIRDIQMMHPKFPFGDLESGVIKKRDMNRRMNSFVNLAYELPYFSNPGNNEREKKSTIKNSFIYFIENLGNSQVSSIDTFLAKCIEKDNKSLTKIGKFFIACLIYYYESNIYIPTLERNWIQQMISTCILSKDKLKNFLQSPPNFITFNYDMFLEKCIQSHLISFHRYSKQDSLEVIKKLNIIHVYGNIDSLENKDKIDIIKKSMSQLNVVGEQSSQLEKVKNDILQKLALTRYLYFLGFGFDEQNMKILFPNMSLHSFGRVFSTNIGLSEYDINVINEKYYSLSLDFSLGVELDCLKMLKEKLTLPSLY